MVPHCKPAEPLALLPTRLTQTPGYAYACKLKSLVSREKHSNHCTYLKRVMVQLIRSLWDTAVNNNLNLVRFFAFAVSPEYALQPSPGQYSEAIFRGLDYALEQLRSRGLKVGTAVRITLMQDRACRPFRGLQSVLAARMLRGV